MQIRRWLFNLLQGKGENGNHRLGDGCGSSKHQIGIKECRSSHNEEQNVASGRHVTVSETKSRVLAGGQSDEADINRMWSLIELDLDLWSALRTQGEESMQFHLFQPTEHRGIGRSR